MPLAQETKDKRIKERIDRIQQKVNAVTEVLQELEEHFASQYEISRAEWSEVFSSLIKRRDTAFRQLEDNCYDEFKFLLEQLEEKWHEVFSCLQQRTLPLCYCSSRRKRLL